MSQDGVHYLYKPGIEEVCDIIEKVLRYTITGTNVNTFEIRYDEEDYLPDIVVDKLGQASSYFTNLANSILLK